MAKSKHATGDPAEVRSAWLFNLPLVLLTVAFILIPVAGTLVTSFYRDVTFLPKAFVGLENYGRLFADLHFWQSLRFTLLFVLVSVVLVPVLLVSVVVVLVLPSSLDARLSPTVLTLQFSSGGQ